SSRGPASGGRAPATCRVRLSDRPVTSPEWVCDTGRVSEHDPLPPLPPFDPPSLDEPADDDSAPDPGSEEQGRVCWVDLDGPDRARRVLGELRAWMDTVLVHEP